MDVFVLPSWREGLPRSAIEAAASGLPLVLTDIRGCREVARDGIEGFLVPVRDPRSLAGAIIRLLDDPELRTRMGAAARARAEERFDERRVTATVVQVTEGSLQAAGRLSSRGGHPSEPRVRRARTADAEAMARLHADSMPTAFLPTLGRGFLVRLYRGLIQDRHAIAMVADDGSRVVGVATAVPSVGAFYRRFAFRRGVVAALAAAPKLRPTTVRRAIETARYPSTANDLPDAELLSIAVDDSSRSDGVGSALVSAIAERLALAGVRDFKAVVGTDNAGANRFYERNGFVLAGSTAVHEGERSNVWTKRCRS